ncbi:NAD-dependent epimerase/dehydratase family protein [Alphaproteobacteria bacterium]|nr:NAD-dependent epimerase/dehydratase family protein [Alphaproteobacteria bacterium]
MNTSERLFEQSKILIVGGAGFVGSNLCHRIISDHNPEKIWVVDNLLSSEISNLPKSEKMQFILGSIANDQILNQLPTDIDYVFHLSCFHGNQSSIENPLTDHENNTYTSLKLFDHLSRLQSLKKVVYAAAGCAVAAKTLTEARPTKEDEPVSLFHDSPYSISKLIGEMYGNYYWTTYQLPFVKARFQNVYGPKEILGAGSWRGTIHTVWRNVVPTFIWKSLQGSSLPLENSGKNSRDFIFVDDLVHGLISCAANGKAGEAYNLASGTETKIIDLASKINEITGNIASLKLLPKRSWDNSGKRFGDTAKSFEELGFRATTKIEDGLKKTISWTIKNSEQIQRNIEKHDILITQNSK